MADNLYTVKHTRSAERDLNNIFSYIAIDLAEPFIASDFLDELDEKISKLSEFPNRHPLVDILEFRKLGYRKMVINSDYIVLYTVLESENIVFVERVVNARRNWAKLL